MDSERWRGNLCLESPGAIRITIQTGSILASLREGETYSELTTMLTVQTDTDVWQRPGAISVAPVAIVRIFVCSNVDSPWRLKSSKRVLLIRFWRKLHLTKGSTERKT